MDKIGTKVALFVIFCSLVLGGIGGWVFSRYIIPKINTISFLTKYNLVPTAGPVVINTREEVRVNEGSDSIAAIKRAKPWLVGILNNGDINTLNFSGSGIILSSDGLIATTASALSTPVSNINIAREDGTILQARLVATDPASDLALLKAEAANLPTAQFGFPQELQLGQRIIILTRDFAKNQAESVITNVASEVHNDFSSVNFSDDITQAFLVSSTETFDEGAMFISLDGNVQGIHSSSGIITADTIKAALNNYFTNKKITRPSFGFYYQKISQVAANALNITPGLLIKRLEGKAAIVAGSPAQKAGLREGDIVIEINGSVINDRNSFEDIASNTKPQQEMKMKILRNKVQLQLTLIAVER